MGLLKKFMRQFATPDASVRRAQPQQPQGEGDSLDDDLRKMLQRLPASTKRNLLQELGDGHGASTNDLSLGSIRQLAPNARPGLGAAGGRRATAPTFAPPVSEIEPFVEKQETTADGYARALMEVEDLPELSEVKALYKALKKADEDWVALFRDSGGMAGIYKAMAELAESREAYMEDGDDNNDHEVPEEEVDLEEELVHCVMILLNKPQGLFTLEASSELLPLLAGSAIDSPSSYVKCNLLKLLTIMAESGASGFESVMNALDYQKVEKDEQLRFALLMEAFGDADSSGVALVTDLIVFFNTVLSGAFEFEERVLLRSEMIAAGILEAMSRIRDYYGLSKGDDDDATSAGSQRSLSRSGSMNSDSSVSTVVVAGALTSETNGLAAQLDLFDTVMYEDKKDAIATGMADEEDEEEEEDEEVPTMDFAGAISMLINEEGSDVDSDTEGYSPVPVAKDAEKEVVTVFEYPPDPPAVASVRSLVGKLEDKEETLNMVNIIAEKLESMANAQCDINQWKKIRDAVDKSLESTLMDSDDSDSDDDEPNLPTPDSSEAASLPPPATGIPLAISPPAERPKSLSPIPPPLPKRPVSPTSTSPAPAVLPLGKSAAPIPAPPALPCMPATAAIPPAPPLPGMSAAAIPAAPPLPGMPAAAGIPMAPPLPGLPAASPIPAAPALPGLPAPSAIPAPPALPGLPAAGAIPMPPALPGMPPRGGIPAPPALPGSVGGIPPPPPLPGMGGAGIPAPPALPGMPRGPPMPPPLPGMGGMPSPPPLPGIGARALPMPPRPLAPALPKKPPGPKRRPVHWEKIAPTKLEKTVFSEIDPNSVELPTELLMDAFVEKPKEKKPETTAAKKKAPEQDHVNLLDSKVLRNNGIVFTRFRTKPYDLRDSIVAMDLDKFDTDKLIALRGISPSPDDLPKLKAFEGDLSKLDEVTLFMVLTAKIPRYQQRLDCALFIKGFAQDANFLSDKLKLVATARREVVESPRLKRLIEVVLAMGNYLNEGTRNGEAKAIKLASLLKLDTVKTMDKKKTLLHVLMGWAKQTEPEILLLDEDLVHASEASQWSLTDLKNQVTQLVKGFTLMQNQLKMAQGAAKPLEGDKFADVVEPFLDSAKDRREALETEYQQVQSDYDSCARRFGEDPTKTPSGDFFSLVSALVDMISVALRENEMAAKAEERRKKREAQEKKRKEAKEKKARDAEASGPPVKLSRDATRRELGRSGRGLGPSTSIRPSRGRGLGPSRRDIRSSSRVMPDAPSKRASLRGSAGPLGLGVNEALLMRRGLIATDNPDDDSDDDSDFWSDEEGTIKEEYERIKNQRVTEAVMLRKISKLKDPSKRDFARGQLGYQKSTIGRQPSMTRQKSIAIGGSPAMLKQVSALRQASNLRQLSAIRQASTVRRGGVGGRAPSVLRPSGAGGGVGARGGLSTGRLEASGMPGGSFSRQPSSANNPRKAFGGDGSGDRRKQFKTLKSTAFLA